MFACHTLPAALCGSNWCAKAYPRYTYAVRSRVCTHFDILLYVRIALLFLNSHYKVNVCQNFVLVKMSPFCGYTIDPIYTILTDNIASSTLIHLYLHATCLQRPLGGLGLHRFHCTCDTQYYVVRRKLYISPMQYVRTYVYIHYSLSSACVHLYV